MFYYLGVLAHGLYSFLEIKILFLRIFIKMIILLYFFLRVSFLSVVVIFS